MFVCVYMYSDNRVYTFFRRLFVCSSIFSPSHRCLFRNISSFLSLCLFSIDRDPRVSSYALSAVFCFIPLTHSDNKDNRLKRILCIGSFKWREWMEGVPGFAIKIRVVSSAAAYSLALSFYISIIMIVAVYIIL